MASTLQAARAAVATSSATIPLRPGILNPLRPSAVTSRIIHAPTSSLIRKFSSFALASTAAPTGFLSCGIIPIPTATGIISTRKISGLSLLSPISSVLSAGPAGGVAIASALLPITAGCSGTAAAPLLSRTGVRTFSTRNIHGPRFWKRRPHWVPTKKGNWRSKWLEGKPVRMGVVLAVKIRAPRKPNSGQRKTCRVKMKNGRSAMCYIPGQGHNLMKHSSVMVRGGRTGDIIGCNYKVIRGKYDLNPVMNRARKRSKYGVEQNKDNHGPMGRHKSGRRQYFQTDEMRRKYFYRTGIKIGAEESVPHIPANRKYPVITRQQWEPRFVRVEAPKVPKARGKRR